MRCLRWRQAVPLDRGFASADNSTNKGTTTATRPQTNNIKGEKPRWPLNRNAVSYTHLTLPTNREV